MPDARDELSAALMRVGPAPKPAKAPAPCEDCDELTIADMNGAHCLRPAARNLTRIHFVLKNGSVRTFQYTYLDAESTFDGDNFKLLFTGVKHWEITVRGYGPKFWMAYDLITLHRCPYIREAAGSMVADGEAVFTSVEFRDVTPAE